MLINIHISIVHNNTFISLIDFSGKLKNIDTCGSIGFSNKTKKLPEVFSLLLQKNINQINLKKYKINSIYLTNIPPLKIRLIKKLLPSNFTPHYKINQKINYNGCRIKKKKRQRLKFKFKKIKKLKLL